MDALAQDFRFAFRQLRKAPGFSLTVVLTLALGIGATTAIFSLVEGILLRPLPFSDPDHLVLLGDHLGDSANTPVTAREIDTYSSATSAFSSLGGYTGASYELSGGGTPEEINGARFTAGVFETLGVDPILGRVFTQQEEDAHQPLAVISYALWLDRYNRDPHVLDRSIVLDRRLFTIIGVMPRSFEFPLESGHLDQAQLWVPMSLTPEELSDQHAGFWGYQMVARLKDGVTVSQAAQDADRVARQIMSALPAGMSAIHIRGDVTPLTEYAVSEVRPLLRTLFLTVSIVLLIACVNVAGLLLVRAIRRRREYALRLALGARSAAIMPSSGLAMSLAWLSGMRLRCSLQFSLVIRPQEPSLMRLLDALPSVRALPPEQMTHTVRSTIAEIDPLLALQQVQPMNDVIASAEAPRRFNTDLITAFALGALLLAITGIYAVVAFSVSLRNQEIAIRMALGAQRTGIARLVLISGAKMAFLGCGLGVLASLAASRLVSSFLFEVSATDPLIYLAGVLLMMLMALLASALPATRAASVDPIDALRSI